MRIVVLGGGTAGYMAVAHISHFFPQEELIHIFDSSIPPIGVGEGTLPAFQSWIKAITGESFSSLNKVCQARKKIGVCFEGWGTTNEIFHHYFVGGRHAYHLSASQLPIFLKPYIQAQYLEKRVSQIHSNGRQVDIKFFDNTFLRADIVFDATGFPKYYGVNQIQLNLIPTNAALVLREQHITNKDETRAIARPHGWVFVIPLSTSTSYGYVYNQDISQEDEVLLDFRHFLHAEGLMTQTQPRKLCFPSFIQRKFFDGALFRIGNAASFLEPLEATALAITLEELRIASLWLADGLIGVKKEDKWNSNILNTLNNHLINTVQAVALFVGWHYACKSKFDTPFWSYAQENFSENFLKQTSNELLKDFKVFTQAGAQITPVDLVNIRKPYFYQQEIKPRLTVSGEFGGFSIPSFAQIGYGIGAYSINKTTNPS